MTTETQTAASEGHEATLRGIATNDHSMIEWLVGQQLTNIGSSGLDARTHALVRLAALIACDAAPASFVWQVGFARESGITPEEMVGVLVALAPTVGMARIVAAAPELAFALGINLDAEAEMA
jgi:4-carboxymuconolactone decarboxylase